MINPISFISGYCCRRTPETPILSWKPVEPPTAAPSTLVSPYWRANLLWVASGLATASAAVSGVLGMSQVYYPSLILAGSSALGANKVHDAVSKEMTRLSIEHLDQMHQAQAKGYDLRIAALSTEVKKFEKENTTLKETRQQMQEEVGKLSAQVEELGSTTQQTAEINQQLTAQVATLILQNTALTASIESFQTALPRLEDATTKQEAKATLLQEISASFQERLQAQQTICNKLTGCGTELNDALGTLNQSISQVFKSTELVHTYQELLEATKEIHTATQSLAQTEAQHATLKAQNLLLQEEISRLNESRETLEKVFNALATRIDEQVERLTGVGAESWISQLKELIHPRRKTENHPSRSASRAALAEIPSNPEPQSPKISRKTTPGVPNSPPTVIE